MIYSNDDLIREVRTMNMTRKDLSILTEISYNTISHWLNGFSDLTEMNRNKITDAISVYKNRMTVKAFKNKYNTIHNLII